MQTLVCNHILHSVVRGKSHSIRRESNQFHLQQDREADSNVCNSRTMAETDPSANGLIQIHLNSVAYPGILFGRGGGSTNSVEDRGHRERGSRSSSPLVRDSGGSCNLVQEISFHIVKFS